MYRRLVCTLPTFRSSLSSCPLLSRKGARVGLTLFLLSVRGLFSRRVRDPNGCVLAGPFAFALPASSPYFLAHWKRPIETRRPGAKRGRGRLSQPSIRASQSHITQQGPMKRRKEKNGKAVAEGVEKKGRPTPKELPHLSLSLPSSPAPLPPSCPSSFFFLLERGLLAYIWL